MRLRNYQLRAISECRAAYQRGARGVVLVLPTGAGKTVIAAEIARSHLAQGGTVAMFCHRTELIKQTEDKLRAAGLEPGDRVWVDSVQTAVRRPPRDVSLVVCDEVHHLASDLWGTLPNQYSGSYRLGLTATPQRGDGKALTGFDALVQGVSAAELTALGHLVSCTVLSIPRGQRELADPVQAYREHACGRPTILFASSLAEARRLASDLGGECIDGATRPGARSDLITWFRDGAINLLTSVHVLTEGFDAPRSEVCIIARGAGHAGTWLQMVGRVLRPHPGKASALVLDLRGSVYLHGLPTDDRNWSLSGKVHSLAKLPPLTQCRQCGAVYRSMPQCPRCGYASPPKPSPRSKATTLVRVDTTTPDAAKCAYLQRLQDTARARGYKPGWAAYRFKSRFGHWPTADQRGVPDDATPVSVPGVPVSPDTDGTL